MWARRLRLSRGVRRDGVESVVKRICQHASIHSHISIYVGIH